MQQVVISGTGLFTPAQSISNSELVAAFNAYAANWNAENAAAIAAGERAPMQESSEAFIEKASGIRSRYVIDKRGVLDPARMRPNIPERPDDELSLQCEMAVHAAREALAQAGRTAARHRRGHRRLLEPAAPLPGRRVEVQEALGIDGFAFDMNVACSSATFGIDMAARRGAHRLGARGAGGQPRDLLGPPELPRPRLPLHLRRRLHRGGGGARGGSRRARAVSTSSTRA